MNKIKQRILTIVGAGSVGLGTIGAAISSAGLCFCVWAPLFSFLGMFSLIIGFFSEYKFIFLTIGIIMLGLGLYSHHQAKTCKIHNKFKKRRTKSKR
jgi:hypothetical protein